MYSLKFIKKYVSLIFNPINPIHSIFTILWVCILERIFEFWKSNVYYLFRYASIWKIFMQYQRIRLFLLHPFAKMCILFCTASMFWQELHGDGGGISAILFVNTTPLWSKKNLKQKSKGKFKIASKAEINIYFSDSMVLKGWRLFFWNCWF